MWENSAELGAIGLFLHILDKFLPIYACLVDKYPNFALANGNQVSRCWSMPM